MTTTTEIAAPGIEIALRDGSSVILPAGRFPLPSAEAAAKMATQTPRRAAFTYALDASVRDADGVELRMTTIAALRWLEAGGASEGPEITEQNANVDGYLRARVVFDHPERFAPERGNGRCDCCGKEGPGYISIAPDAMLTPSEVGFVGDCCRAPAA